MVGAILKSACHSPSSACGDSHLSQWEYIGPPQEFIPL